MASSAAFSKFSASIAGARVLAGFNGSQSSFSSSQPFTDACVLSAGVAQGVGCWEGYLEAVLREFVSKTRVQAHRRAWTLIVQFEALVDKMASDLNTPNWDKCRDVPEKLGLSEKNWFVRNLYASGHPILTWAAHRSPSK